MFDPQITALMSELEDLKKTRSDAWQIPRAEGELLHHITFAANVQIAVEIGTSYGYSGLFFGHALKRTGGRLHTIDISQKKFDSSKTTFGRAGLAAVIVNHLGDARKIIPTLPGPFDLVFIDADKPATRAYFDLVWPKLRIGGSVLIDNAITHKIELADVLEHIRSLLDASTIELAVGNGLEWIIKTR